MDPYYTDDHVTLYHGDCREIDAWLAADVLVTDPPYGMAYVSNRRPVKSEAIAGDLSTTTRDAALAAWGSRPALCFGTWKAARPQSCRQVLVWDKTEGNGTGALLWSPWGSSHEEIYVLGDWPAISPGGRHREGGTPARSSGVLRVPNYNTQAANRPEHPTPKPVRLMEELILKCPLGVVADPFAGSGATLVAARNAGRKSIGVEVSEQYCELIASRLAQRDLFGGAA